MMGRLRVKSVPISEVYECDSDPFTSQIIITTKVLNCNNWSWNHLHCTAAPTWSRSEAICSETGRRFHLLPPSDCSIGGQSAAATTSEKPTIMIEKGSHSLSLCPTTDADGTSLQQ